MLTYEDGRLINRQVLSDRDTFISKRLKERCSLRVIFRGRENDVDSAARIVMLNKPRYSGIISAIKACANYLARFLGALCGSALYKIRFLEYRADAITTTIFGVEEHEPRAILNDHLKAIGQAA